MQLRHFGNMGEVGGATFEAKLRRPADGDDHGWAFLVLPQAASDLLPRRGRSSVTGAINSHAFAATSEPDANLSHWLRLDAALLSAVGAAPGDVVSVQIESVDDEPEPVVPVDFAKALSAPAAAHSTWRDSTVIARIDWVHWIVSAKQAKTRALRIAKACSMLAADKRRVCCFDPSGHYSKAFGAPKDRG